MSDPVSAPSAAELLAKVHARATANGADPAALLASQAQILTDVVTGAADALNGDARSLAHLEAQLRLGKFSAEAKAFVEAAAWATALKEVLLELLAAGLESMAKAAAMSLVSEIEGGFK